MRRRAVTLTELTVGIAILSLLAGAFTLSPNLWRHTAKHEAERLAAKITAMTRKADATRTNFILTIDRNIMNVEWGTKAGRRDETFRAHTGFVYYWNAPNNKLTYSHTKNTFTGGTTISVQGKGESYYVIIAVNGGRIRVSDTHPQDLAHTY